MHPWKNIIKGKTDQQPETKACFMCLERIPSADGNIEEFKEHLSNFHLAKHHLEELVTMCSEVEEKEEREGWSIEKILEEERERETSVRKSIESEGWLRIFIRGKTTDCLDNNEEALHSNVICFLCQEKLICVEDYNNHLEIQHKLIFGVKEVRELIERYDGTFSCIDEQSHENEEVKPEIKQTDADTIKDIVEMKYLSKKRKIRLRTPSQKIFSPRKYRILIEEVSLLPRA